MASTAVGGVITSAVSAPNVSQGPLLERLIWALLGVSILVVVLRLYTKWHTARRLFVDDVLMVFAVLFGLAHAIIIQLAIEYKFGQHIIDIFVIVNVVGLVVFFVQCGTNLDTFWTFEKQFKYDEYCWNPDIQTDFQYGMGAFNTATDAFLSILPAILVEHTLLSRKNKIGLALLLCLSIFAMGASIVKTYEAKVLSEVTDYTYSLSTYVVAMSVELNVVIITASIPLLRPLWKRSRNDEGGPPAQPPLWHTHIPLSSAFSSKNHSRTNTTQLTSMSSLDQIVAIDPHQAPLPSPGITVTTEVEVTYQRMDAPHVHAALVGLIQGERENPRLARY
ncbi:hypothetical protein AC578_9906 [Pseudocercospora eumusae]|uniref:Rhodopsin domain-containing protein n=1 Tax=Pseudocercospora eumusae TaxID=321146 RepID=A0A139HB21_9PEZI|nr:hypothetical protein AC578_9906 [Pseudocercospora eumusae]